VVAASSADDQKVILEQLNKIGPNTEQLEAFRSVFRSYYQDRNDASRRVLRTGGDVAIKMRMKLDRITEKSINSMSPVLTVEQMKQYQELLNIANEQFMASAGLN
jgi:hypothetical protein